MPATTDRVTKTPDVCGGRACIRGHRIPVWGLVNFRRLGASDTRISEAYPSLTAADLEAAWQYAAEHPDEIERDIWENEACMVEHDGRNIPAEVVRRGRQLGVSDEDIRNALEPPLSPELLSAILSGLE